MKKESLQNFTENNKSRMNDNKPAKDDLTAKFRHLLTLKGAEYDDLFDEIKGKINETGRTILRDRNFQIIQAAILDFIKDNKQGWPTVSKLALITNLSRVTVGNHLKEMFSTDIENEYKFQSKHVFNVILANLGKRALNGDLKAIKLYLDTMMKLEEKDSIKLYVENQQNNIVVNS